MILTLINKVLIIIFFLSILNIIRHTYYFIQLWLQSDIENPVKYKITNRSLLFLGLSIAYILMAIFTGIGL